MSLRSLEFDDCFAGLHGNNTKADQFRDWWRRCFTSYYRFGALNSFCHDMYNKTNAEPLRIKFEIALPNEPDAFKVYVELCSEEVEDLRHFS